MKRIRSLLLALVFFLINATCINATLITTLNNNDPIPMFTSAFPYDFLSANERECIKDPNCHIFVPKYISFSVSPFYQRASKATCPDNMTGKGTVQLGDINGRWNMIALLPFNSNAKGSTANTNTADLPPGYTFPDTLTTIGDNLLTCIADVAGENRPEKLKSIPGLLSLQTPQELFGFFSVPIRYRKRGVRLELDGRLGCQDFGFSVRTGVAQIVQRARFIDMTTTPTQCVPQPCLGTSGCPTNTWPVIYCQNPFPAAQLSDSTWRNVVDCVHKELMLKLPVIAKAMDIDICNFSRTSMEDLHAEIWWRHMFPVTGPTYDPEALQEYQQEWYQFIFTPFVAIGGSLALGDERSPDQIFSLPFGNNGHNSFKLDTGASLDFFNTVELGMEGGFTIFFSKKFNEFRVPNNIKQNPMYPFKACACVKPGTNWHLGLFMNAYHFLDKLSFYLEYVYATHERDKISVCTDNSNGTFKPEELECKSKWSVQVINFAFNYDVSPNFTIGGLGQWPIQRRNAYRSTTWMVTLQISF